MLSYHRTHAWFISYPYTDSRIDSKNSNQFQTNNAYHRAGTKLSRHIVSVHAQVCASFSGCLPHTHIHTLWIGQEDEAPDTSATADEQPHRQHHPVLQHTAQPAHQEETRNYLHPTQAVHHTVPQLAKAKVLLRQRGHHGLEARAGNQQQLDFVFNKHISNLIIIISKTISAKTTHNTQATKTQQPQQ